ncbi:MAG: hypothetical protein ABFC24_04870 [Methanoregulaceae archaeon]
MIARNTHFFFILFCGALLIASGFSVIPVDAGTTTTIQISGNLPFNLYNISTTGIDTSNATVTWNTNGNANSTVEYGTTTGYGSTSTDAVATRTHAIRLYTLSSGTVYHYRVLSTAFDGASSTSTDATFKTLSPDGTTVANTTQSTSFTGTAVQTTGGVQNVQLNVSSTSGTTQVSGNTVTIQNPGNGWSKLQYTGANVTSEGGNLSIEGIQSVTLESEPVTASLGGNIGTVSTQIEIGLTEMVPDLSIQQNVIQGATTTTTNAFQVAAAGSDLDIKAIAYTVEFKNTETLNANLNSAGVTLNLSVDHAWVVANAPDGNVNNIKILRFGDDGTKEVLSTRYLGSQGSTDFFEATSPHGLSVFGVTAVTTSSGNGGGNGGGGGGSSGGTSGSTDSGGSGGSIASSLLTGQQPAQISGVPAVQPGPQPGPIESAATTTRSLSVAGLTVTRESQAVQVFSLDTAQAEQSGATITVTNNEIAISQPGFTLTIVTRETPTRENGILSGTIERVGIRTAPAYADLEFGTVSVAMDASLDALPENGAITTAISDTVSPGMEDIFRTAAVSNNLQVDAIAYIAGIGKTNVAATRPARLTFTIPSDWVTNHGGPQSIIIAHFPDQGSTSLLQTNYLGTDAEGTMTFSALSPAGLSTFGLLSVQPLTGSVQPSNITNGSAAVPLSISTDLRGLASYLGKAASDNLLLVISLIIILLSAGTIFAGYSLWSHRKKDNRNRPKNR